MPTLLWLLIPGIFASFPFLVCWFVAFLLVQIATWIRFVVEAIEIRSNEEKSGQTKMCVIFNSSFFRIHLHSLVVPLLCIKIGPKLTGNGVTILPQCHVCCGHAVLVGIAQ